MCKIANTAGLQLQEQEQELELELELVLVQGRGSANLCHVTHRWVSLCTSPAANQAKFTTFFLAICHCPAAVLDGANWAVGVAGRQVVLYWPLG